jgi:hypothetical protein
MRPKASRHLSLAIGVAVSIVFSAEPPARAADAHDPSAIGAIYQRSLTILGDINDTVGGALLQARASGDLQSANCLGQLRDTASEISDVLVDVNDLDTVESGMIDGRDQKFAVLIRNLSAKGATKQLAIYRRTVNQTEGECANQGLVQQKARDLIQLIDDATAELETMK